LDALVSFEVAEASRDYLRGLDKAGCIIGVGEAYRREIEKEDWINALFSHAGSVAAYLWYEKLGGLDGLIGEGALARTPAGICELIADAPLDGEMSGFVERISSYAGAKKN
jgi:hypothetical protein